MSTQMYREILEIPEVVARQLDDAMPLYRAEAQRLKKEAPEVVLTCARGSSDHAATYFKYLVETVVGRPVASIGPSVASVYGHQMKLGRSVCFTISQSGGSPDLVAFQRHAQAAGARTVALLNVVDSPVAASAMEVLPMFAGPETAVAATKSHVASLVALALIVANWAGDLALIDALKELPDNLHSALGVDWSSALLPTAAASSLFTLARGPALGIANEAALKFKETCRLHAEAFSAAEVQHGPIAIASNRFVTLAFQSRDASGESVKSATDKLAAAGARVFVAGGESGSNLLPTAFTKHPLIDPIAQIVTFYRFVEALSVGLGEDPDRPALLSKVTETV
jgi:glutamine---fructose-6-phosphate transaminase (isomerizing)